MKFENLIKTNKPILITGESGTGKSILAQKIHANSPNCHRPFLKVNLASLAHNLFESELFGHLRGSFTGANSDKLGILEKAQAGTVFFDEIGELDLSRQVKLLHLLDDGSYYRVGSPIELKFKGKFIFATNKNLEKMVSEGTFRQDLYFRIRYCSLVLPVLRMKSTGELTELIWNQINDRRVSRRRFNIKFGTCVMEKLINYPWPGNYRELINTIDYLFDLEEEKVLIGHLPNWFQNDENIIPTLEKDYYRSLAAFEKKYLEKVMYDFGGQINKTALEIGLSKVTLISKLKKYDIDRRQYRSRGEAVGF